MKLLGIDAVFHDPAAALVIDDRCVAAAEGAMVDSPSMLWSVSPPALSLLVLGPFAIRRGAKP